jgi:hypothetical protein
MTNERPFERELPPGFDDYRLPDRALRALEETDGMPRELRECVHEFGYAIVRACLNAGVRDPARIRQLVAEIWRGARHQGGRRVGRPQSSALNLLDWVLLQAGAQITAAALIRLLDTNSLAVVVKEPTSAMVDASMSALDHVGFVSKRDKHKMRLRAGIAAAALTIFPPRNQP